MLKAIVVTSVVSLGLIAGSAQAASDYAKTKYPVVFAPGVLGFDKLVGFVDYWYGIPGDLRSNGATVFITSASAFNSSELRGEQFLKQAQDILAVSGAAKINIIAHSHGGFSARYAMDLLPGKVASVTTMSSPHKGTPVADVIRKVAPAGSVTEAVAGQIGNAFSYFIDFLAGTSYRENVLGTLASMTTQGVAEFNSRHPDGVPASACGEGAYSSKGIRFYSLGGAQPVTNVLDPLDGFFGIMSLAFVGKADSQSDGLIGRCSNHFGQVIRDNYPWNHPDEINHTLGVRGLFTPNPVDVYRGQVNRLKVAGY